MAKSKQWCRRGKIGNCQFVVVFFPESKLLVVAIAAVFLICGGVWATVQAAYKATIEALKDREVQQAVDRIMLADAKLSEQNPIATLLKLQQQHECSAIVQERIATILRDFSATSANRQDVDNLEVLQTALNNMNQALLTNRKGCSLWSGESPTLYELILFLRDFSANEIRGSARPR